jgi:hypothetical protein
MDMTETAGVGLILMLVGCGSPMQFTKPGYTDADFNRDKRMCDVQLGASGGNSSADNQLAYVLAGGHREDLQACMETKGWRRIN